MSSDRASGAKGGSAGKGAKDVAVSVRGLAKSYTIARNQQRHTTAGEALLHKLKHPLQKAESDTFWALQDVSFDVHKGDVVGIIGRNGAGKSTLLKILSQITEPTAGEIRLYGRVGSLLEVGTGFHPELTGRENIFLNGAILGMRKSEITRQFDAIVDFAEVEQFLDTPVKRYSSGMYVRLAFAVAAHLNPEILIVDEVLAVGDAAFQKKCLGKMQDISNQEGKTVLFVSHNMAAVENLCSQVLLLAEGKVFWQGNTEAAISTYLSQMFNTDQGHNPLAEGVDRSGNGKVQLTDFHLEDSNGEKLSAAASGLDTVFALSYRCHPEAAPRRVDVGISVHSMNDQLLFVVYSSYTGAVFEHVPSQGIFRCQINSLPLAMGSYRVGARVVVDGEESDWPRNGAGHFDVEYGDFYGSGHTGFDAGATFLVNARWDVAPSSSTDATHVQANQI